MEHTHPDETYRIPDSLWAQIKPLLPPEISKSNGDHSLMDQRQAMEAILYVFRTGCMWKSLPESLGSPSLARRRFREWQRGGVFQRMWHADLLTYDEMRKMVWYDKEWIIPPER